MAYITADSLRGATSDSFCSRIGRSADRIGEHLDTRMALHRFIRGSCQLVLEARPHLEPARLILNTVSKVNAIFDLCDLVGMVSYFFSTQDAKRIRLVQHSNTLAIKPVFVERQGLTMAEYHLTKGNYIKVFNRAALLSTLFTGTLLLGDMTKLIDLAGSVGAFAPALLLKMTLGGAILVHGSLALDAARYILAAHQGDTTKDAMKGWLKLAYRSMVCAFSVMIYFGGFSNPLSATVLALSGIIGVKSELYTLAARDRKREEQEMLYRAFNHKGAGNE